MVYWPSLPKSLLITTVDAALPQAPALTQTTFLPEQGEKDHRMASNMGQRSPVGPSPEAGKAEIHMAVL